MKETELYESVRGYFISLGFTVRAEVKDIDICAVRDDLLVGIELKRNFSTDLLIQAVHRQKVCDLVYIAVPKPKRVKKDRSFRNMLHLLNRLELGLLYVDVETGNVTEVLEPAFYDLDKARRTMMKVRRTILSEIKRRTLDGNVGGSNKTRLLTAYREESLKAVALIRHKGIIAPKDLKAMGIRPGLLNDNFYGWFEKVGRGRYALEKRKAPDYAEYEGYIEGFLMAFMKEAELHALEMGEGTGMMEGSAMAGMLLDEDGQARTPGRAKSGRADAKKPALPAGGKAAKTSGGKGKMVKPKAAPLKKAAKAGPAGKASPPAGEGKEKKISGRRSKAKKEEAGGGATS